MESVRDEGLETASLGSASQLAELSELRSTTEQLAESLEAMFDDFERLCTTMAQMSDPPGR